MEQPARTLASAVLSPLADSRGLKPSGHPEHLGQGSRIRLQTKLPDLWVSRSRVEQRIETGAENSVGFRCHTVLDICPELAKTST